MRAQPSPPLPARWTPPSAPRGAAGERELARTLLAAKEASGKTFTQIAQEVGLTNLYTAQLFLRQVALVRARGRRRRYARAAERGARAQAQLKEGTAEKLRAAVPALPDSSLAAMKRAPLRQYDPLIVQDPLVYRLTEVRAARA